MWVKNRVLSEDPWLSATVLVLAEHDEAGRYYHWEVSLSDGRLLAEERSEVNDGEPTQADAERYLAETLKDRSIS